jgi:hypothetical protein
MRMPEIRGLTCHPQTMIYAAIGVAGLATSTTNAQKLNTIVNFEGSNEALFFATLWPTPTAL